jgi:phosphatidylglycerol:prolipoprotein diacylglycerol transferase
MAPALVFHWDVNPIIVQVGPLAVRWYGLFFATAFLVGSWIMRGIYQREGTDPASLDRLFLYMPVGAVLGARLGHVLLYDPQYYFTHPLESVKIWEGGLASHGGAVGVLLALYFVTRRPGSPRYLWLLDRVTIPTALGGALIRAGNFFNSEIVGTPTTGRWGIIFDRVDPLPRHPVQLYEALAYALIFLVLRGAYSRRGPTLRDGWLLGLFLILVFGARFLCEFVKTPQAAYEVGFALTVGQLLSLPCIVAGFCLFARASR